MITLVAVVMLFVIGAMAVLAIDVASFYTARSEAQLAADSGALAGARVLANSGVTSIPGGTLSTNAQTLAIAIATQVATQNQVGGRRLQSSEVTVTPTMANAQGYNPLVTVQVTRTDLPTYFARIWGDTIATVTASATAEAYNPSGAKLTINGPPTPVATTCVKPFVLPNFDENFNPLFDNVNGQPEAGLVGKRIPIPGLTAFCTPGNCSTGLTTKMPWQFFPGDPETSFQASTQSLPSCETGETSDYQVSIAGCVQQPIACGGAINSTVNLYTAFNENAGNISDAVNCLTHSASNGGDQLLPNPQDNTKPFQFIAGTANPVIQSGPTATIALVSDSLVTIPVANVPYNGTWTSPENIIGFLQVFINPDGTASSSDNFNATITNVIGCGTAAQGTPIIGNGPSAVAVRLIHP